MSNRKERRQAARDAVKTAKARLKLAALGVGGAEERPIEVDSASVIEPHATSMECPACGAQGARVEEHLALRGVRVVKLLCPRCGTRREVWFRIRSVN